MAVAALAALRSIFDVTTDLKRNNKKARSNMDAMNNSKHHRTIIIQIIHKPIRHLVETAWTVGTGALGSSLGS